MPFILRKIRKARWHGNDVLDWLLPDEIQADSLLDLSTKDNQLSIYIVEDDRSNLERIIAALAGNCDFISNVDYALVPAEVLSESGIEVADVKGETSDEQVNEAHRDLIHLSASKLLVLAKAISIRGERTRLTTKKVRKMIGRSIANGYIDKARLKLPANEISKLKLPQQSDGTTADHGNRINKGTSDREIGRDPEANQPGGSEE
ncbi:MAG TPA: hypothetical protein VF088_00590 [Pyrinomonadaceae bacterium]